jgi:hypothetical protein
MAADGDAVVQKSKRRFYFQRGTKKKGRGIRMSKVAEMTATVLGETLTRWIGAPSRVKTVNTRLMRVLVTGECVETVVDKKQVGDEGRELERQR